MKINLKVLFCVCEGHFRILPNIVPIVHSIVFFCLTFDKKIDVISVFLPQTNSHIINKRGERQLWEVMDLRLGG